MTLSSEFKKTATEALFNHFEHVMICLDENCHIIEFNEKAESTFRISKKHVLNQHFFLICNSLNISVPIQDWQAFQYQQESIIFENLLDEIPHQWTVTPLFNETIFLGALVIGVNSIAKKIAYQEKNNAESTLNIVVNNIPHFIFWKNTHSVFMGCNKRFAESCGFDSIEDVIGKTDFDMPWSHKQSELYVLDDQRVMRQQKTLINYEENQRQKDGSERTMMVSKVPLQDDNNEAIGIFCIYTDITHRIKIEKELQLAKERAEVANKAKSEFIAIASHELRIPLTGILGMIGFLKDDTLSAQEKSEYISYLTQSSKHLLSLIDDILDFAKLEAEKFELMLAPLNLKDLVEEIILMLSSVAKAKKIELMLDYTADTPHQILADSRAIRRILVNLISNAIKFTEKGHVRVSVQCVHQTTAQAQILFLVEDTGIGIPENMQSAIFEHFKQVSPAYNRTSSQAGTGLGLAITKKLVEMMNGELGVISELNVGSTFSCALVFPLQDKGILHSPWDNYKNSVRVIIIDDTARGNVLRKQLGSHLTTLVTGDEAVATMNAAFENGEPYDIIIVDGQLTTINPFTILRQLQQQHPLALLLTSGATLADLSKAKLAGFFDTISKPITPLELQTCVTTNWEHWLEKNNKNNFSRKSQKKMPLVLLVEDDPVIQIVHKRFIKQLGCELVLADTGKKAIALARAPFDLILMDIGVPEINGIEATIAIRQFEKMSSHQSCIIGLTGYSDSESREKCLAAGMDNVLIKPIELDEIKKIVDGLLIPA